MRRGWAKEKDLQDFLEYEFKKNGCERSAYIPVVAGGEVCMRISRLEDLGLTSLECSQHPLCPKRRHPTVNDPAALQSLTPVDSQQRKRPRPSRCRWGKQRRPRPAQPLHWLFGPES
jgi:hypothetical protein